MLLTRAQIFGKAAHLFAVISGQTRSCLQQRLQCRLKSFARIDLASEVTDRTLLQASQPLELQRVQTVAAVVDVRQSGPRRLQALRHLQLRKAQVPAHSAQAIAERSPLFLRAPVVGLGRHAGLERCYRLRHHPLRGPAHTGLILRWPLKQIPSAVSMITLR